MENSMTEAVHEAQNSEKVVRFINHSELKEDVINLIDNGNLHGLYYNEDGEIVAEDIWGDVHENVTK